METDLHKKYGLFTAIAMVVGIVIGSGVFFKAEKVLNATGGDMTLGIIAWLIGGAIMIICAYSFALLASKYEKVNGIVDYAEASFGKKYGYIVGWFMATIYYPTLTCVLAWLSARYTCVLLGFKDPVTGPECFVFTAFYLVAIYAINALSPVVAGRFQVSTTIIKLIPLALVAVVGIISGLINGMTVQNFTAVASKTSQDAVSNPLLTSVVATAFAYEGWIIATSINAELKDSKRNLPKALVVGTFIVVVVYVLYFIGIAGAVPSADLMQGGEQAVKIAFSNLFGSIAGTALIVFVVISCLGTCNGLMLGCTRGMYSLAARDLGPDAKRFKQIDKVTNMPNNSSILGLLLSAAWLIVWYGDFANWWGLFLDISELPIVTMYALYIPIFIWMMVSMKELNSIKRVVVPALAIAGSVFMIIAAFISHGYKAVCIYLIIFVVIMIVGLILMNSTKVQVKSGKSKAASR